MTSDPVLSSGNGQSGDDVRHGPADPRAELRNGQADAMLCAAESVDDDAAVEIGGVRIERCDEFGDTATTRDLRQTRLDLAATQKVRDAAESERDRVTAELAQARNEVAGLRAELRRACTEKRTVLGTLRERTGQATLMKRERDDAHAQLADAHRTLESLATRAKSRAIGAHARGDQQAHRVALDDLVLIERASLDTENSNKEAGRD